MTAIHNSMDLLRTTIPPRPLKWAQLLLNGLLLLQCVLTTAALGRADDGSSITASPQAVSIYQGSSRSTTLFIRDPERLSGDLEYSITSPLPRGVTAYFSNQEDNSSCVLTLTASESAAIGETLVTIKASSRYSEATTALQLSVRTPEYILSVSPLPFVLSNGSSATSLATVVPWGDFRGRVSLSAPQLPAGISVAFNPASTDSTSQLIWKVSDTAPASSGAAMIYGSSPDTFSFALFNQTITASPIPTFTLGVSPAYLVLEQGSSATDTIVLSELNGFEGDLDLSATQLPAGVTATFKNDKTRTQSILTIAASAAALPGNYNVAIWASTHDRIESTLSPLYVTIKPRPAFTVAVTPESSSVGRGETVSSSIMITRQPEFTDPVELSIASDLPEGVSASFDTNPARQGSRLNVTTATTAPPGSYFLNVEAASGASSTVITVPLTIKETKITATPMLSVPGGTYNSVQMVSILDATPNASIHYTVDGTEPTAASSTYTGPVAIKTTETLQAIAIASGYWPSQVASASYIISIPMNPVPTITSLSPPFVNAGASIVALTINGTNFGANSSVLWGADLLRTEYVSPSQLTAHISADQLAAVRSVDVFVLTPAPGGGVSNPFEFQVNSSSLDPAPRITPSSQSIPAGSAAIYDVGLAPSMSNVSASCLNLPHGTACRYDSGKLRITTGFQSPTGTYQVTAVFCGNYCGGSGCAMLVPLLLVPGAWNCGRRRRSRRSFTIFAFLLLLAAAAQCVGCGGTGAAHSGSPEPPASQRLTTSVVVGLTIQ